MSRHTLVPLPMPMDPTQHAFVCHLPLTEYVIASFKEGVFYKTMLHCFTIKHRLCTSVELHM
jgi:hypothetical protein